MDLRDKRIVVAIGGGIAAFKAVEVVRELQRRGATVRVAMTASATRFVGPITLTGLTGTPAVVDLWDPRYAGEVHVELGAWADAVLVAPATMNLLGRAAAGLADDVVLATVACARGPVIFAPAMHTRMWTHPATTHNVERLRAVGAAFVGPVEGPLASGEIGMGRLAEPARIVDAVEAALRPGATDLEGVRLLVSAGPTHEDLDPVRFLGNRSSGKMGFALAERAAARGALVTLVSGPVALTPPAGVTRIEVRSALQMREAIASRADEQDAVVMAAAVADYRPSERAEHKRKKAGEVQLTLVRNPDILLELGERRARLGARRPVLVGFALETQDLLDHARAKLERKKVDLIVANEAAVGFAGDTNRASLVDAAGATALPAMSKHALADRILDRVRERLGVEAPPERA